MPAPLAVPLILGGASLISGWLSGRKKQSTTSTSTPTMDPAYGPLQSMLIQRITDKLKSPTALPKGFETGGIRAVNDTYDAAGAGLENSLTARGLSRSPVAGAPITRLAGGRARAISDFRTQTMPDVERQYGQEDLMSALQLMMSGRGQTSTSEGGSYGGAAGGMDGLAGMLGFLYGHGAFGQKTPTAGKMPVGGVPNLYQGF